MTSSRYFWDSDIVNVLYIYGWKVWNSWLLQSEFESMTSRAEIDSWVFMYVWLRNLSHSPLCYHCVSKQCIPASKITNAHVPMFQITNERIFPTFKIMNMSSSPFSEYLYAYSSIFRITECTFSTSKVTNVILPVNYFSGLLLTCSSRHRALLVLHN